MAIIPDTKNWTWVLERPCPECGLDVSTLTFSDVPSMIRQNVAGWAAALDRDDVRIRPDESTWSTLEYAAHVRDAFRVYRERLALMLEENDPPFANWDQDAAAVADRYNEQDPVTVGVELADAGEELAVAFEDVPADALGRTGLRSDGSAFTVESLALYFIHDPVHHLWDVTHAAGNES
ncbi:MAG: hypothetical protein QOF36_1041 [Microbacteriaceae bacterium]|jgi:hypothetical protein|nr:hypothetical protein [Microbacteriaceae bacterium]